MPYNILLVCTVNREFGALWLLTFTKREEISKLIGSNKTLKYMRWIQKHHSIKGFP